MCDSTDKISFDMIAEGLVNKDGTVEIGKGPEILKATSSDMLPDPNR
jgi:hypothetical protein